ncbi:hypothetical protein HPP92_019254 [Vanilla planifolia]|uniref:K+ potassium transporter integral membrane domain-containing protein n=1 Tax=Vanilla planifolia TaxID=51239 RepID=A0A835Q8J1_VANPL|nr:hypothetical protein HPP92_019254 [Vanilla planifolia]
MDVEEVIQANSVKVDWLFLFLHTVFNLARREIIWGFSLQRESWKTVLTLAFQSLGVVYGDLSTSPLYVYKSTFSDDIEHSKTNEEIWSSPLSSGPYPRSSAQIRLHSTPSERQWGRRDLCTLLSSVPPCSSWVSTKCTGCSR